MFGKKSVTVAGRVPSVAAETPHAPVVPEPGRNWVAEMAGTATAILPLDGSAEAELERLSTLHSQLFPIEADTKERVGQRMEELRSAKELPYQKLSLEPLTWRRNGRPVFAVYSLDSAVTWISGGRFISFSRGPAPAAEVLPELPRPIEVALIKDVTLPEFTTLRSAFSGVIPANVRDEITKARPLFSDKVYIVAEANWEEVVRPKGDPLVVGWRANALWLVAQFDTTDVENYYAAEFPA